MRYQSFRHRADSEFCFNVDATHVKVRLLVDKEENVQDVYLIYEDTFRFGTNNIEVKMRRRSEDAYFHLYEAVMEGENPRFRYLFRVLSKDGKSYYVSESGLHEGFMANLGFLSTYQICGEHRADYVLDNPAWSGRVFYNIFPERFASGIDPKSKSFVNIPWRSDRPMPKGASTFAGGDLLGIEQKLPYLKRLGVGAIYLNPIYVAETNHRYDILDYFHVDPKLGGDEAFLRLAKAAHELDIKIVLDLVFNHTSVHHPFFLDCLEKGRNSPYFSYYFINGDFPIIKPCNYKTFGFHAGMPKLDTSNPAVMDYLISIGKHWLAQGADGFRLDVSDGVSHAFWKRFKIALKEANPDVLLIGENWLNGASYLDPDELDGLMDYPCLGILSSYALGIKNARETALDFNASLVRYKDGNNRQMLRLLSSHDIQRFFRFCKKDKGRFVCCYAALYFYLGFPNLYYGDEVCMDGGGDPDCRRPMDWNPKHQETPEFEAFVNLGAVRQEKALKEGDIEIDEDGGMLIFKRFTADQGLMLAINLSGESKESYALPIRFGYRLVEGQICHGGFAVYEYRP